MLIVSSTVGGGVKVPSPSFCGHFFVKREHTKIARPTVCKRGMCKVVNETECEMQLCSVLGLIVSELALVSNVVF